MRRDTKQWKHAMAEQRTIAGAERLLRRCVRVWIRSSKQALDTVMLKPRHIATESIMLIKREEQRAPSANSPIPSCRKWPEDRFSLRTRRSQDQGDVPPSQRHGTERCPVESYTRFHTGRDFIRRTVEENPARSLRAAIHTVRHRCGASARRGAVFSQLEDGFAASQEFEDVTGAAPAVFTPYALFLTQSTLVARRSPAALGVDLSGEKRAFVFWYGSFENHEYCETLLNHLERRNLAVSKRIQFLTDGGSGMLNALRYWFGKMLVHQPSAIYRNENVQRHVAKPSCKEVYQKLATALE